MLPIFYQTCCVGARIMHIAKFAGNWCEFVLSVFFDYFDSIAIYIIKSTCPQTVFRSSSHVDCLDQSMDGSDEPYTWFSVRSLLCKSFWADSGDFQAETKMRRLLGKVGRFFVWVKKKQFCGKTQAIFGEKLKMCRFLENRAIIGQIIQYADFKANSGGGQKIKCLGLLRKSVRFAVRN